MATEAELRAATDEEHAYLVSEDGPLGLWIHSLWPWRSDLPMVDKKRLFLAVLRRLLDEERVVLFLPNGVPENVRTQAGHDYVWNAPTDEMIAFVERHWPNEITDENDIEFTYYWYDPDRCPGLGWVVPETGEIIAS